MQIFDIDGVVANLQPFFVKDICERAGCTPAEIDVTSHNLKVPGYNLSDEEIFQIAVYTTVKYVDVIKPYKYSIEYLENYQHRTGNTIHFLTARSGDAVKEATYKWLNKHLDADYTVHFDENKVQFMKNNPQFDMIVEDRYQTANALDFVPKVYLINRPWNIGRITKSHVIRIDSLYQPERISCCA